MNRLFRTALIKATLKPDPRKDFHELAPDVLLTGAQAAAVLGVSPLTIRSWRYQGLGPRGIKLGRALRFSVGDLRAFLRQQRQAS